MGGRRWSQEEISILSQVRDGHTDSQLCNMFPNRTLSSIRNQLLRTGHRAARKKHSKWTDDEIQILIRSGHTGTAKQLTTLLPRHSWISIAGKRRKLGISTDPSILAEIVRKRSVGADRSNQCKIDQSLTLDDLDNDTFQLLLGSLLGDGCVKARAGNRNFIFVEQHSAAQADYVRWKASRLNVFHPVLRTDSRGGVEFATPSHPMFTLLRDAFYTNRSDSRKTYLPYDIVSRLDLFGLLIWYLDDGCLASGVDASRGGRCKSPIPHITSVLFSEDDLVRTVNTLNDKFGLTLSVVRTSVPGNKRIYFGSSRTFLLNKWRSFAITCDLPTCMHYKLNLHDAIRLFLETHPRNFKIPQDQLPLLKFMHANGISIEAIAAYYGVGRQAIQHHVFGRPSRSIHTRNT